MAADSCISSSSALIDSAWSSVVKLGLNPARICRSAGFCGLDPTPLVEHEGEALPCELCHKLATFIDADILEDPTVQVQCLYVSNSTKNPIVISRRCSETFRPSLRTSVPSFPILE